MATNHLGHFLLTELLLPLLVRSQPSRIINISSDAHRTASLDFHSLEWIAPNAPASLHDIKEITEENILFLPTPLLAECNQAIKLSDIASEDVLNKKEAIPLNREKYSMFRAYARSKLANILFTRELARRLRKAGVRVTVNALHPGVVDTGLTRPLPKYIRALQPFAAFFFMKVLLLIAHVSDR